MRRPTDHEHSLGKQPAVVGVVIEARVCELVVVALHLTSESQDVKVVPSTGGSLRRQRPQLLLASLRRCAAPLSAVVMPENVESAVIDCPSWPNKSTSSTW